MCIVTYNIQVTASYHLILATIIRGITLLVFSPLLRCLGYGFDWSKGIVLWWGALRGAVSLALALLVAEDETLDPHVIGNKVSVCQFPVCQVYIPLKL